MYTTVAEQECKTNPAGNGYRGSLSTTADGHQCIDWTVVENSTLPDSMNIVNVSQAKNYCRRLAETSVKSASCVTRADDGQQFEEPCQIHFCGKIIFFARPSVLCSTRVLTWSCLSLHVAIASWFMKAIIFAVPGSQEYLTTFRYPTWKEYPITSTCCFHYLQVAGGRAIFTVQTACVYRGLCCVTVSMSAVTTATRWQQNAVSVLDVQLTSCAHIVDIISVLAKRRFSEFAVDRSALLTQSG